MKKEMRTFEVTFKARKMFEVEAVNEEDAVEKAWDELDLDSGWVFELDECYEV